VFIRKRKSDSALLRGKFSTPAGEVSKFCNVLAERLLTDLYAT
jgi:hypothetical protein